MTDAIEMDILERVPDRHLFIAQLSFRRPRPLFEILLPSIFGESVALLEILPAKKKVALDPPTTYFLSKSRWSAVVRIDCSRKVRLTAKKYSTRDCKWGEMTKYRTSSSEE